MHDIPSEEELWILRFAGMPEFFGRAHGTPLSSKAKNHHRKTSDAYEFEPLRPYGLICVVISALVYQSHREEWAQSCYRKGLDEFTRHENAQAVSDLTSALALGGSRSRKSKAAIQTGERGRKEIPSRF